MSKTGLKQKFAAIFNSKAATTSLASLGGHVRLRTFNLATSSLRHLDKWYDRLEAIEAKKFNSHPNYISDPTTIGLVKKAGNSAKLTRAGQEFLSTKAEGYKNSERAEYELLKVLYFSAHSHSTKTEAFLAMRKQNLVSFLSKCSPTPSRHLLLDYPRLLTVGECIWEFDGALLNYLSLSESDLEALRDLGEKGFKELGVSDKPAGFKRICSKIGSEFTRADERRLNMLVAMALLEIRDGMARAGTRLAPLKVPYPYCNLLSETDVQRFASS